MRPLLGGLLHCQLELVTTPTTLSVPRHGRGSIDGVDHAHVADGIPVA